MFKLSTTGRLGQWKNFRNYLNTLSLQESLEETLSFWQSCPFSPCYLEVDSSTNWPDPWTLIEENYYCDLAKVLGIVYTLHLTVHRDNLSPEIHVYINNETRYQYHIAYFCQGKYVLNLIEGEIVNKEHINQELQLKYRYTATDLNLNRY
jgi:hypothetical protein